MNFILLHDLSQYTTAHHDLHANYFNIALPAAFIIILLSMWFGLFKKRSQKVFLIDFACYKPPITESCSKERVWKLAEVSGNHSNEVIDFMKRMMHKTGLGDSTYLPEALLGVPLDLSSVGARQETQSVVFGAIDQLFGKISTRSSSSSSSVMQAQDIGILIVNCSLFNVAPSLSSMIVNRYKLRENIASYSLSGMGCSSGLIAISLANQLLQVHKNTYALVVSTENISGQYYKGNEHSKIVVNCIFRVGGAAILLSNRPSERKSSKYQLLHTIRTHTASSDRSYKCIFQEEDEDGFVGVTINKDLIVSAVNAIKLNLASLAPLILPFSEKILVLIHNFVLKSRRFRKGKFQPYIPNFSKSIHHFFPHVGGKIVLDELQKNLGFSDATMEASRMTLYRFGNTASSAVWYSMAYSEAKGRIKKGDLLWQMGFGSGFKCSSVIWRATREVINSDEPNPWSQEIHKYPLNLNNIQPVTQQDYYFEPST